MGRHAPPTTTPTRVAGEGRMSDWIAVVLGVVAWACVLYALLRAGEDI